MYTAIRGSSTHAQSTSQICSKIHSSAVNLKQTGKGSSRTRLAKNLKPGAWARDYEEQRKGSYFDRASAPHQDANLLKKFERPSHPPRLARVERPDKSRPPRERIFSKSPVQESSSFVSAMEAQPAVLQHRKNPFQTLLDDPQESEFYHPPSPVSISPLSEQEKPLVLPRTTTPTTFSSPPLLPGFIPAISQMLGDDAKPTPIQSLSIKWLIEESGLDLSKSEWKQFLLASETGSGKSLAYLLPLLQKLKLDEQNGTFVRRSNPKRALNPRAIVLAPTHELARQLSSFAKALTHDVKLKISCVSQRNTPSTTKSNVTAKKLSEQLDAFVDGTGDLGELDLKKDTQAVDVLFGTPVKVMELIRGRGWDEVEGELKPDEEGKMPKLRRGRDKMPGGRGWKGEPKMGLENVEWVIVDEADVLFDPDFQEVTRTLLSDISAARGKPVEVTPNVLSSPPASSSSSAQIINYPFNFILTSATIPKNLATYLDNHHPNLVRLTSPRVHHLPKTLKTEYVPWSGGNKYADIERRVREVWASDAAAHGMLDPDTPVTLSKVLIFCNKSLKVMELATYLGEKGIRCVALTSNSEQRKRGSNKHLEGFLRPVQINPDPERAPEKAKESKSNEEEMALRDPKITPHVMITTSLLSRGLDFSPDLGHVFIVDEPRNMVDFLHRAGRSGRAGHKGKVVIFSKMKGRGSQRSREVKEKLKEFTQGKI
ncbi:hypothetical protein NP233_g1038 [Leucocoprinus birnbaumii]|uniref:RNA helicase n=1 Tax=Leucocoprinus birnbaumii TaxID=56174 RepID=A0AAD5W3A5_9AGAR|nr:hypothetical protein NP233_g1038 [Leucocoprinus birnbaumii]